MFVLLLKFGENRTRTLDLMPAHKAWIDEGLADGVFLLIGSLMPQAGGAIIAYDESRANIEERLARDPFVVEGVVTTEIFEIAPNRAADSLRFLLPQDARV